jgi:hypothetical protein
VTQAGLVLAVPEELAQLETSRPQMEAPEALVQVVPVVLVDKEEIILTHWSVLLVLVLHQVVTVAQLPSMPLVVVVLETEAVVLEQVDLVVLV